MAHNTLEEDWSDYVKRKLKYQVGLFLSCEEPKEMVYRIRKIKKSNHEYRSTSDLPLDHSVE